MQPLQEDMTTFVLDETTIASGTLLVGRVAVQVLWSRVRLNWMQGSNEAGKAIKTSEIKFDSAIKYVRICDLIFWCVQ